jgi:hypothetical protein
MGLDRLGDEVGDVSEARSARAWARIAVSLLSAVAVFAALPIRPALAAPPSVSINDVSVTEGAQGTTTLARFTLTLSAAARKPVNVKYITNSGSAVAGSDYVPTSGTATIKKGTTTRKVVITVNGDNVYEGDETFTLHLISAKGASIATPNGTGTIVDDDPVPTITIANASVLEGTDALNTTPLSFDVTLDGKSSEDVTVDYASADGTASQPGDYGPVSGTLTWPAGTQGTQQVTVQIVADPDDEADAETFTVGLTNPTGLSVFGKATGDGIILDDDLPSPPPPAGAPPSCPP